MLFKSFLTCFDLKILKQSMMTNPDDRQANTGVDLTFCLTHVDKDHCLLTIDVQITNVVSLRGSCSAVVPNLFNY